MFSIYVISSQTRKYIYVGLTNDINRRVKQHQEGKNKTTRAYRPYKLIVEEKFQTRSDARAREKYLKSGVGKEWIKEKICGDGGMVDTYV